MAEQIPVILAGADFGDYDVERSMNELWALAESAELAPAAVVLQKRDKPEAATYIGQGKLAEIHDLVQTQQAQLCVFDAELTGTQIKNIEKAIDCEVMDRTMLILDIFSSRATSGEGKLQTELARLSYRLPRLSGLGASLSRQGGGGGGGGGARRGAGESQLEYDRRHIRRRMELLQKKLKESAARKEETRRRRQKNGVPVVALVGYTNVGKSSLLNALCGADVLAENKLFATLDPTARSLLLPSGQQAVLIDTVGFVSRLPHDLVEAFKSTLEEAKYADILLKVCDASDSEAETQMKITGEVLESLGCTGEILEVYNKCDAITDPLYLASGILVSAKTGQGLGDLLLRIDSLLAQRVAQMCFLLPYEKLSLAAPLQQSGAVLQEEYLPEGVRYTAVVPRRDAYLYEPYLVF